MNIIPQSHRLSIVTTEIIYKYETREDALGRPDPKCMKGRLMLRLLYGYYEIGEINHRIEETEDILVGRLVVEGR